VRARVYVCVCVPAGVLLGWVPPPGSRTAQSPIFLKVKPGCCLSCSAGLPCATLRALLCPSVARRLCTRALRMLLLPGQLRQHLMARHRTRAAQRRGSKRRSMGRIQLPEPPPFCSACQQSRCSSSLSAACGSTLLATLSLRRAAEPTCWRGCRTPWRSRWVESMRA
jgi:hypothetical protein